jgi:hypothetical protein
MIERTAKRRDGVISAGLAAWLIACCGCGGSGALPVSSSSEGATVHGTVSIKGKPATAGKIFFNPANINRKDAPTVSAEIGKDGAYTTKTLVGENQIYVESPETKKDPGLASALVFDVKSGDNTFNVSLPPQ